MPKTKTDDDAREMLRSLGLNPDAPALDHVDVPSAPSAAPSASTVKLAPEGVDPHTMPVTDITFDPALLDDFPVLSGDGLAAASRHVFALYKSRGRDKDRNSLLHREIGLFITRVRRSRESGTEHVKDQVRATKPQRDLLALLAQHGITSPDDLLSALGGGQ